MLKDAFLDSTGFPFRSMAASLILIVNTFVWYLYAFNILAGIIRGLDLVFFDVLTLWVVNFVAAAISALTGAFIANKISSRVSFLLVWMLFGTVSSFTPIFLDVSIRTNLFLTFLLFGVSFGLGMPTSMAYFANSTFVENRARFGGIIFLVIGLVAFFLGVIDVTDTTTKLLILTVWRGSGVATLLTIKPSENFPKENKSYSYKFILTSRSFLLYFIPWIMFCLVNQTSAPVIDSFFDPSFIALLVAIEGTLAGTFAIISGFFCDRIGRRRVAIFGFIMLGVGYATLGIFPYATLSFYFYSVADGIAWGIFYTVFFTTIWGDLAGSGPGDKYYALGGLPYLLSNLLRIVLGPYIAKTIAIYTIFSLASFFLFLAVLPLMYAPETLPEKQLRERELKIYIDKAKKIKGKMFKD